MGTPQIIMIVLITMSLMINLFKHGENKGEYNFWTALIGEILEIVILKWGGFF